MEVWELVRRLLAAATGGDQTFTPGFVGGLYYHDLVRSGHPVKQTFVEVSDAGELFGEQMQEAGLIRAAGVRGGGIAILGAMERTAFGEELYQALHKREVVALLEHGSVPISADEIREALHQVN